MADSSSTIEEDTAKVQSIDEHVNCEDPLAVEEICINMGRVKRIDGLAKYKNLKYLALVSNIVESMEGISEAPTNLEHLEIYQSHIRRIEGLDHLTGLKNLDLSFNRIRKIKNIDHLKKLTHLYLTSNKIEKIEPLDFPELIELELGSNRIQKMENLEKLPKLEKLWFGKNKIAQIELPMLGNLRILDVRSNRLTKIDKCILQLPSLEEFHASHNQITDVEPGFFKDSPLKINLRAIDLCCNAITDLTPFTVCTNLEELYLNGNQIGNAGDLDKLTSFKKLVHLAIHDNPLKRELGPTYMTKLKAVLPDSIETIDGHERVNVFGR